MPTTPESSSADRYPEYTFDSHRRPKRLPAQRKRRSDHAHRPPGRTTVHKVKSRSIHQYDATRTREVVVTCPTQPTTPSWGRPAWTEERRERTTGATRSAPRRARAQRLERRGKVGPMTAPSRRRGQKHCGTPGGASWPGASRAADLMSPLPMDSLTIHGAPLGTSRGLTRDPGTRPRWAEAERARAGSAGTMTRAAVIAPWARPQTCCDRRQVRAADVGTGPRPVEGSAARHPCKDARAGALGTAASMRTAVQGGTGRIGLSSSSASRWRCTVCTPSSTAGDGTGVRGHRCAGIETQPKRAPLT